MDAEKEKYLIVRKELESKIVEKLQLIKTKVESLPSNAEERAEDLQRLLLVDDELDDVLFNWSERMLSLRGFDSFDDFDD
jgi:hypothetical protein